MDKSAADLKSFHSAALGSQCFSLLTKRGCSYVSDINLSVTTESIGSPGNNPVLSSLTHRLKHHIQHVWPSSN
ncbi:hypothetical protein JOB18_023721 [Solea senegalensis]|uniref:Uncharacterized protein n=1 Tax=Solea senegalensis TaxID=28829 RepID=A0AAV6RBC4_SOLSE|nr:hypothetical protein JOB18_023721 [Solea senegalensis]